MMKKENVILSKAKDLLYQAYQAPQTADSSPGSSPGLKARSE